MHFPIKEFGYYLLFVLSIVPHVLWIVLLKWCIRRMRSRDDLLQNQGRRLAHLIGPALVLATIFVAVVYEPGSPLQKAIQSGEYTTALNLLEETPDLVIQDLGYNQMQQLLLLAIENKDIPMIDSLLDAGADVNRSYGAMMTPLFKAIYTGNRQLVKHLIECGADVNPPSAGFYTPLMNAISCDNDSILTLLLEKGADVNSKLTVGRGGTSDLIIRTPLKVAAKDGSAEMVRTLLRCGAAVNQKGSNDDAAIHMACRSHNKANEIQTILTLLIESGADINDRGYQKKTPLHIAAGGSYVCYYDKQGGYFQPVDTAVIKFLLENGADIRAIDDSGMTALDYARKNGLDEIADLIQNFGT
jgi:ankyrin repeat protein